MTAQKDVHNGSSAEEDNEEYLGHDYGDTNAEVEDNVKRVLGEEKCIWRFFNNDSGW